MSLLRVWAPFPKAVSLERPGASLPMHRGDGGWWTLEAGLEHGDLYRFGLDGDGPFPDPRSAWQPEGALGPSAWVDHTRFPWTDQAWQPPPLARAVFYELHVGCFSPEGGFEGVIPRLKDLARLGVTHLELMPVAQFSGSRGWGYDGVQLYAPQHSYGGPEGLKRLVDAAHAQGLAMVLDVVYNHLGPEGNSLPRFGPYFSAAYPGPWGDAPNFDGPDSPEVRDFFIGNALHWLRHYHFDALRLDAVQGILDRSALHFLEELSRSVAQLEAELGRPLALIAESDLNDPRIILPRPRGGYGLHAQWNEDFHHALYCALSGERGAHYADFGGLAPLAKALERGFVYDGQLSRQRRRRFGRPLEGLPAESLLGYLQNHDQMGNRADGARSAELLEPGQLRVAAALVALGPFLPLFFMGEEWGCRTPFHFFTDFSGEELARRVREGRARDFAFFFGGQEPPDPQDPAAFLGSKLRWEEREGRGLLSWHQGLLLLRRHHPSLQPGLWGELKADFDEAAGWLRLRRGQLLITCNFSQGLSFVPPGRGGRPILLLGSEPGVRFTGSQFGLPAYSVGVWTWPS